MNLFFGFLVLFLLHDELLHQQFPIVLLRFELIPQFLVLLKESPILIVDPLSYVCNELKVMLKFILTVLKFRTRISSLALFALFNLLFHLGKFRVELSDDVFLLFLFEL